MTNCLEQLEGRFSICKLDSLAEICWTDPFLFFSRTDQEISIVCRSDRKPKHCIASEEGFAGIRICGTLDFSLVGILAKIAAVLADAQISVFAVSTYDTDYLFIREESCGMALDALSKASYHIS